MNLKKSRIEDDIFASSCNTFPTFIWRRAFCMVGQAFGFFLPDRINPHGAVGSAWRVWTRGGRPRFSCNFFLYRQFLCFTYFFKDLGLKKRKFVLSRFCCVFIVSAVFFRFCCVAFVCFCCVFIRFCCVFFLKQVFVF